MREKKFRWTQAEEERLVANVEKHVLCLSKAFEITAKEIRRSPQAYARPMKANIFQKILKLLKLPS